MCVPMTFSLHLTTEESVEVFERGFYGEGAAGTENEMAMAAVSGSGLNLSRLMRSWARLKACHLFG
jgi:hypothetical protein